MTNEEIDGAIARLFASGLGAALASEMSIGQPFYDIPAPKKLIEDFARSLVAQAYEEAADKVKILADYVDSLAGEGAGAASLYELEGDVRALKDSLSAEPVSS